MTTTDPFDTEPKPLEGPVFFNCFQRILGAGWEKTATMAYERAQGRLIKADQKDHNDFHCLNHNPCE